MGPKKKVIVYVDGFNFYFGLRAMGWKKFYWLDIVNFFDRFMTEDKELVMVKYFTARPLVEGDRTRQAAFLDANLVNPRFQVIYGTYASKLDPATNRRIGTEEKKTDVAIGVNILIDAIQEKCNISMVVTGDTDQVPAIRMVKLHRPKHGYFAVFPPMRENDELRNMADAYFDLIRFDKRMAKSILPESVENAKGRKIFCPPEWKAHMS